MFFLNRLYPSPSKWIHVCFSFLDRSDSPGNISRHFPRAHVERLILFINSCTTSLSFADDKAITSTISRWILLTSFFWNLQKYVSLRTCLHPNLTTEFLCLRHLLSSKMEKFCWKIFRSSKWYFTRRSGNGTPWITEGSGSWESWKRLGNAIMSRQKGLNTWRMCLITPRSCTAPLLWRKTLVRFHGAATTCKSQHSSLLRETWIYFSKKMSDSRIFTRNAAAGTAREVCNGKWDTAIVVRNGIAAFTRMQDTACVTRQTREQIMMMILNKG